MCGRLDGDELDADAGLLPLPSFVPFPIFMRAGCTVADGLPIRLWQLFLPSLCFAICLRQLFLPPLRFAKLGPADRSDTRWIPDHAMAG